jgi:hypothetical protein
MVHRTTLAGHEQVLVDDRDRGDAHRDIVRIVPADTEAGNLCERGRVSAVDSPRIDPVHVAAAVRVQTERDRDMDTKRAAQLLPDQCSVDLRELAPRCVDRVSVGHEQPSLEATVTATRFVDRQIDAALVHGGAVELVDGCHFDAPRGFGFSHIPVWRSGITWASAAAGERDREPDPSSAHLHHGNRGARPAAMEVLDAAVRTRHVPGSASGYGP